MLRKCTVLISVLVAVQSASFQGRRSIPVEVRYERLEHNFLSNLSEKVQLSPEELKENELRLEKLTDAEQENLSQKKDHSNAIKNLDEKVQLSPEELLQASKHIPIHNSLRTHQDINELDRLGELRNEPTTNKVVQLDQLQGIIDRGLEKLKDKLQPKENDGIPSKEAWEKLETEVKDYFTQEKNKLAKQDSASPPETGFQNVINWFQKTTTNFINDVKQQNPITRNETSGGEGTQSQGAVQQFLSGAQSIYNTLVAAVQSPTQKPSNGNSTVLGDNGIELPPFVGNIINNAQQFFQGTQKPNSSAGAEDTGGSATQGGNIFQNIIQSVGTAVNQFTTGGQNKPQGSEDENGGQASNPNLLQQAQNWGQNVGQNIGNFAQNFFNQFSPQSSGGSANTPASTDAPSKQAEDSSEKEDVTTAEPEKKEEMTATE